MNKSNVKDKLNQVIELAGQSMSQSEISKKVGVSKSTVARWLKQMDDKTQDLTEVMVAEAVSALRQRVKGYQMVESKTTFILGADNILKVKERVEVTKDVAPDLSAIIFLLTNKDRNHWQQKPESNAIISETCDPNVDITKLSEQTLEELYKVCSE